MRVFALRVCFVRLRACAGVCACLCVHMIFFKHTATIEPSKFNIRTPENVESFSSSMSAYYEINWKIYLLFVYHVQYINNKKKVNEMKIKL